MLPVLGSIIIQLPPLEQAFSSTAVSVRLYPFSAGIKDSCEFGISLLDASVDITTSPEVPLSIES